MNTESNIEFLKSLSEQDVKKIKEASKITEETYNEIKQDSDNFEDERVFEDEYVAQSLQSLVETIKLLGINPKPEKKQERALPKEKVKKVKANAKERREKEREKKLAITVDELEQELKAVKSRVLSNVKFKEEIEKEVKKYLKTVPFRPAGLGSKTEITEDDFESKVKFLEFKIKTLRRKIFFYKSLERQDSRDFQIIAKKVGLDYSIVRTTSRKVKAGTIGAKKEKSLLEKAQRGFKKWWNS